MPPAVHSVQWHAGHEEDAITRCCQHCWAQTWLVRGRLRAMTMAVDRVAASRWAVEWPKALHPAVLELTGSALVVADTACESRDC